MYEVSRGRSILLEDAEGDEQQRCDGLKVRIESARTKRALVGASEQSRDHEAALSRSAKRSIGSDAAERGVKRSELTQSVQMRSWYA